LQAQTHAALTNSKTLVELVSLNQTAFTREVNGILNRIMPSVPTLVVECCVNGCMYFVNGDNSPPLRQCTACSAERYKKVGSKESSVASLFYFSIYDRLYRLLSGDFAKFMDYPLFRTKTPYDQVDDILDSECFHRIQDEALQKNPHTNFIGIVACVDKAVLFKSDVVGIEPISYYIANLPGPLRYLVHIGTHIASLTGGLRCANYLFASELELLWRDGFTCQGRHYTVAMVLHNTDGKGFEDIWRVQGSGSKQGSTKFNDATGTFISRGRVCHDIGRRMLPMDNPIRYAHNNDTIYIGQAPCTFSEQELRPPLVPRGYDVMMQEAAQAEVTGEPVNGIKGLHPFVRLPYAKSMSRSNDLMHAAGNVAKQFLKMLVPHCNERKNRCVSREVLAYEHERGRFLDLTVNGAMPWTLSKRERDLVNARLDVIQTSERSEVPKLIMKHMGRKNTHEILVFAFNYAQHCMGDLGSKVHMCVVLRVFRLLRWLCADSLVLDDDKYAVMIEEFALTASAVSGMFPISELTFAFSQLLPIILELRITGPPRRFWMFRFEALHKLLK
jgi:hypothetical protein